MSIVNDMMTQLGVAEDDATYRAELGMYIQAAIDDLKVIGVPTTDIPDEWAMFPNESQYELDLLGMIQQYIYITTKLLFDPPLPSVISSLERRQAQLVFHLKTYYDVQTQGGKV